MQHKLNTIGENKSCMSKTYVLYFMKNGNFRIIQYNKIPLIQNTNRFNKINMSYNTCVYNM